MEETILQYYIHRLAKKAQKHQRRDMTDVAVVDDRHIKSTKPLLQSVNQGEVKLILIAVRETDNYSVTIFKPSARTHLLKSSVYIRCGHLAGREVSFSKSKAGE